MFFIFMSLTHCDLSNRETMSIYNNLCEWELSVCPNIVVIHKYTPNKNASSMLHDKYPLSSVLYILHSKKPYIDGHSP